MPKVKFIDNKWVQLEDRSKDGMYIDGYLKKNLDMARDVIKNDWDMLFVYDGYEGSGKSVKCMQDAFYCDPSLTLERVTFNPQDFKEAIIGAKQYQAVVLDEAYGGLSSRGAMSWVNQMIVQMLTVIRAKNLFVFIVLPSFFDLDKYVALWRSRALIHVYAEGGYKRGYFKFYNASSKKRMYVYGKKEYNYNAARPDFIGHFTNYYPLDEAAYRDKKAKTSMQPENKRHSAVHEVAARLRKTMAQNISEKPLNLTRQQAAMIMGVADSTIKAYIAELY